MANEHAGRTTVGRRWALVVKPFAGRELSPTAPVLRIERPHNLDVQEPTLPADPGLLLVDFARLAVQPHGEPPQPARVLNLANRFDGLRLCLAHGLPLSHGCDDYASIYYAGSDANSEAREYEAVADWIRLAAHVRGLLRIGADLQQGKQGSLADWRDVEGVPPPAPDASEVREKYETPENYLTEFWANVLGWEHPVVMGRSYVSYTDAILAGSSRCTVQDHANWFSSILHWWIAVGFIEVSPKWDLQRSARPALIRSEPRYLVELLARQLLDAVMAPKGLFICSSESCGIGYTILEDSGRQVRRPRAGTRPWCPRCGRITQHKVYNETTRKKNRLAALGQ